MFGDWILKNEQRAALWMLALACVFLPSSANAHPGDATVYLLAGIFPLAVLVLGPLGIFALFRTKIAGKWSSIRIAVLIAAIAVELFAICVTSPIQTLPVVVGRYQGSRPFLAAYIWAFACLMATCWVAFLPRSSTPSPSDEIRRAEFLAAQFAAPIFLLVPFGLLILKARDQSRHLVPGWEFWLIGFVLLGWFFFKMNSFNREALASSLGAYVRRTLQAIAPLLGFLLIATGYMYFECETAYHINPGAGRVIRRGN